MYKIMSNHCTYSEIQYEALEPTILVEENVIWENQENDTLEGQESVHYADDTDILTETVDETYMTADGDNTTQYFSVLDASNQTILNDISDVTINNSIIDGGAIDEIQQNENNSLDINNGQVVLFKVDGSEDLYGFQLTHDDEGNLQKYQFKVRQNEEGTLEAVPETLQILPVENDIAQEENNEPEAEPAEQYEESQDFEEEEEEEHEEELQRKGSILVKEEQNFLSEEQNHPEYDEEETFEEPIDSKEGIIEISQTATHKQEIQDEVADEEPEEYTENAPPMEEDNGNHDENQVLYSHEHPIINEDIYQNEIAQEPVENTESQASEHYEELFVKESHLMEETNGLTEENGQTEEVENLNDSGDEEYETVDGVHVTGDFDECIYENPDIRKSPSYLRSTIASRKKIIKNVFRKVRIQKNDGKSNLYYLIKNTEKENMGQAPSNSITVKPNPRSILKCSVSATEPIIKLEEEEKYDKRFAKSKEAQQARLFHNFIAQTKIIHAPVRQERLPRKQQIKPMERTDEEIVVQEVVVSSNGFIETSEEGVLKERVALKPTEFIQLTDSDDDFDPKSPNKKKRKLKKRKPVEITISDSEEEHSNESTTEPDDTETSPPPTKRPRGRPPKQQGKEEEKEVMKRPRGRPPKYPRPLEDDFPEEEIIVIKIDHKCPKCPKSFPSEGSLRSHMQYHNFSQKTCEAKYICEKCGDTFKNNFLLNRHMDSHKTSNIACIICKKIFKDQAQLLSHKKTHIKDQMFKATNLAKDSPKCIKTSSRSNKCEDCGKIFSNLSALNIHKKQHKRFSCQNCKISFISKFMLDNHLRLNCVKKKSPNKRLSLNVRRVLSPKPIPKRVTTRQSVIPQTKEFVSPKLITTDNKVVTNIKCDSCSMTFVTYTSLFKHKVVKHGLDIPDKSIINDTERKLKRRTGHSGVPPSAKLRNAYMSLRSKLEK